MGIKVRATRLGFYKNERRNTGVEFEIESEKDFGSWMEKVLAQSVGKVIDLDDDAPAPPDLTPEQVELERKVDEARALKEMADALTSQAAAARAELKPFSKRELREKVESMEQAAKEAHEAADEAMKSVDQEIEL